MDLSTCYNSGEISISNKTIQLRHDSSRQLLYNLYSLSSRGYSDEHQQSYFFCLSLRFLQSVFI
jgi:hypothetical protein